MSDYISREDALTALNGSCSNWQDDSKVADIIKGLPSAKVTGDLISRADAIELLTEIVFDEPPYFDSETLCRLYAEEQINTLPSAEIAETEPIAIRSKTLMPTKDFKEWAKRIREVNPNAVVIPCDAEVTSAEAEHTDCTEFVEWIMEEVMDDENWELNAVALGEIICRKLKKLGLLEVKDDVYVYDPSAEAVQGEWIEVEVLPEVYDIEGVKTWGSKMQCDQCGFRHTAIEGRMAQYNYCPNCGARMKGGAE